MQRKLAFFKDEQKRALPVGEALCTLPTPVRLSRRALTTIHCNLAPSISLNLAAVAPAATGLLSPVWGAPMHNPDALAAILNSVWLLRRKGDAPHA